jgi:tRNA threonylcarbamoyladenosine biosynthesis protein TsaE
MSYSHSLDETRNIAQEFLNKIQEENINVVGLRGNLGSGKTSFVKAVGEILGIKEAIQSPTYVIQKIYEMDHPRFKKLYHLDLYRIEDQKELSIFRFEEIFESKENLVLIEWPERANQAVYPGDMIYVNFEFIDENTRNVSFD